MGKGANAHVEALEPLQLLMPIVANSAESPPIQLAQAGSAATQLAQAAVPGAAEIGQVTELTGSAFVTRAGGATEPLLLGDPIFLNDIVETGPGATVGVTFIDGTDFTLSGTGRMAIDRLIFNPGGSDNQLLISLLQGTFGFVSGQIAENAGPGMSISTPVGTIGVRGTAGVGDFDLVRLLITLLQGAILFSNNVAQALIAATFDTLNVSSADQAELTVAPMTPEEQAIYDALLPRILERVEPEAGTEEDGEAGPSDSRASNPTLDVDGLTERGTDLGGGEERRFEDLTAEDIEALAQQILADLAESDPNLFLLVLALATGAGAAPSSAPIDFGFENPPPDGFAGWDVLGEAQIETAAFGSGPTEGLQQALITTGEGSVPAAQLEAFLGLEPGSLSGLGNGNAIEGSAIRLQEPVFLNPGDVLGVSVNFLTDEILAGDGINDFAFAVPLLFELADVFGEGAGPFEPSATIFSDETGFFGVTFTAPESGNFAFGFGVVDVVDDIVDSGLLIDNITITPASEVPRDDTNGGDDSTSRGVTIIQTIPFGLGLSDFTFEPPIEA